MEEQKQCGCCSCRCDRLEKELIEQRELTKKYKIIANEVKDINAYFDDLYHNIMEDTQNLGACIQRAKYELKELDDKNAA